MTDNILDNLQGSRITDTPPEYEYNMYDTSKVTANEVGIDNFSTSGEEIADGDRLARALRAKERALNNLNNNASLNNSYTDLGNGWFEHNGNKMWNDMSDLEAQSLEYYMRTQRALKEQEDGTRLDEQGNAYTGKARRNYNYGTKSYSDSVTKYGAARGDIDNSDHRYNPTTIKGRRYGWKSGDLGVDTQHKGLDVLYRQDEGDMLEALLQGRKRALAGRTVKGTVEDAKLREQYGDGWSEYYNSPEAFMGKRQEVDLELGRNLFNQYMAKYRELKGLPPIAPSSTNPTPEAVDPSSPAPVQNIADKHREWLGQRESSNNYRAVNRLGYLGKYQFGGAALQDLGYKDSEGNWTGKDGINSTEDFLSNPEVQEKAQDDFRARNLEYLESKGATKYIGTTFKGVPVTQEGLLTAAHLVGAGAVSQMLRTGEVPTDANGTSALEYLAAVPAQPEPSREGIAAMQSAWQAADHTDSREAIRAQQAAWQAANPTAIESGLGNTLKGFGATFASELLVNPADAIGDLTGWYDLGTEEEKTKAVNNAFGYDPRVAQKAMERIGAQWDIVADENASTSDRMRAAGNGILEAIVTPELLGTSLGAVLSWVTPGTVLKVAGVGSRYHKVARTADVMAKTGKITKTQALQQKAKAFMSIDGAKAFLASQSGFAVAAMGNINNQYEEFVANNNGKELTGDDKAKWFAERFAVQMFNQNLDKFVDFNIIKSPGMLQGLKPVFKAMTEKEFGNVVTGMAKGLVKTAANMGAEAGQEYAQTMMELYNSRYGSEKFKDADTFMKFLTNEENMREAGIASLAGAGGAVQFEAVGAVGGAVRDGMFSASKAGGKLGDKIKSAKTDPLPSEDVVADEELSEEDRTARVQEAVGKARRTADKYSTMFATEEFAQLMVAEDLKDEELIDAPTLKANLAKHPSSYRTSLDEIEQAEATIESLQGTDDEHEMDGISLKLLRKTKREIYKYLMDDGTHPTLGSGYTPEDVLEEFVDTLDPEGDGVNITKEEQDIVDRFLSINDIPAFRFKQMVTDRTSASSKKDAHTVYRESITDGARSASSYRKRISKLVHTPNPSRKQVSQVLHELDNFQASQEARKTAFDSVMKEQEANINTYNSRVREGKTILASEEKYHMGKHYVPGYGNAHVFVEKDANGYLRVSEASKNISKSMADTIEYNQRTKERYAKHIGKVLGKDHKDSNILVVRSNRDQKKARGFDQDFYNRVGATKAIVDDKSPGKLWKVGADYRSDNASKVNSGVYDSGDVVILNTHSTKFAKNSSFYKELKKALNGGARLVIDRNDKEVQVRDLEKFLTSIGFVAMPLKQAGKDRYGQERKLFVNRVDAGEMGRRYNEKESAKKEKAARKKAMVTAIDYIGDNTPDEALIAGDIDEEQHKRFTAALKNAEQDFPSFKNSRSEMHEAMRKAYDTEVEKQTSRIVEQLTKNVIDKGNIWAPYDAELLSLDQQVEDEVILAEARDQAIDIIEAKIAELTEGEDLVAEWAEIVANGKKGILTEDGKTADQWLEDMPEARAVGKAMLENSIGKNRPGSEKGLNGAYVYYDEARNIYSKPAASPAAFPEGVIIHRLDFDPSSYVNIGRVTPLNSLPAEKLRMKGNDQGPVSFNQMLLTAVDQMQFALRKPKTLFDENKPETVDFSNSPAASLIYDKDLEINQNLAVAAHLALHNYIRNYGYLLGKGNKTKQDIANLLGIREEQVSREVMSMLSDKGMLYKTAANSIGKDIASMMGLERNKASDSDAQSYDALLADLGQTALLMGMYHKEDNPNGVLEVDNTISSEEFATKVLQKSHKQVKDDTGARVLFVNLAEGAKETVEVMSDMAKLIADTVPDTDVGRKDPSFQPLDKKVKKKATRKIRKEKLGLGIAPDSKKALNELMDTEWSADLELMADMIENKEAIMSLMGYITVSTPGKVNPAYEALSFEEKNVQESVNRGIEKSFDEMQWLIDNFKGSKTAPMWFEYYFSKNGRFFIDSNTINPQTDKHLHRFAVQPKSHIFTFIKKDGKFFADGKDITSNMYYAVAQALGMSVDKKDTAAIKKFGTQVFKKLNTPKKIKEAKEAFLSGEKFDLGNGLFIEKEHIGHALQAFKLLQDLATSNGKPVTTSITAEFDAVTSGFGLKLLQMPIINSLYEWLTRVGIVANDDEALKLAGEKSMNDLLDSGKVRDSYQTLAFNIEATEYKDMVEHLSKDARIVTKSLYTKNIWTALSDALPQKVDDIISSELRNLFKPPFMTFNYSATIKNIRENLLTGHLVQDLAKKMASVDLDSTKESDQNIIALMEAFMHGAGTAAELQEMVRDMPLDRIRASAGGNDLEYILSHMIDASYGVQVENILNDYFGPFVEAQDTINASFTAMFGVFITSFEDKLTKLRTTQGAITAEEEEAIYKDLMNQWPAIKGPLSKMMDDGVGIYDTETASPFGVWSGRKPVRALLSESLSKKWGGKKETRVSHMVKQLSAAIAAGSVVPIHYIDGAAMGQTINALADKGIKGITAIHDAEMSPLVYMDEGQQEYNKQTFDLNTSYSFVDEIAKTLLRIADDSAIDLSAGAYSKYEVKSKDEDGKTIFVPLNKYFTAAYNDMADLANNVADSRKELFETLNRKGAMVMHMAGTPGGVYHIQPDTIKYKAVDKFKPRGENMINADDTHTLAKDLRC